MKLRIVLVLCSLQGITMSMKFIKAFCFILPLLLTLPQPVKAGEDGYAFDLSVTGLASAGYVVTDDRESINDGGFGKYRYGGSSSGDGEKEFKVNELAALFNARLGSEISAFLHLQHQPEFDNPVDIVEGFINYRQATSSQWRPKAAIGAFFPDLTFENRGPAWSNRYTISNSAANSWIGQEVRPIGVKAGYDYRSMDYNASIEALVFGWNDVSGTALGHGGFTISDVKTPIFGKVRLPDVQGERQNEHRDPFRELDNRPGLSIEAEIDHNQYGRAALVLWDNFADLDSTSSAQTMAWRTRFASIAGEIYLPHDFTLLPQFMLGETIAGKPDGSSNGTNFTTGSVLLAKDWRNFRFAGRAEYFDQNNTPFCQPGCVDWSENGYALTGAVSYFIGHNHRITAEAYFASYTQAEGEDSTPFDEQETAFQLNYQFTF